MTTETFATWAHLRATCRAARENIEAVAEFFRVQRFARFGAIIATDVETITFVCGTNTRQIAPIVLWLIHAYIDNDRAAAPRTGFCASHLQRKLLNARATCNAT